VLGDAHVKLTGVSREGLMSATKPVVLSPFISAWILAVAFSFSISYFWSKHLSVLVEGVRRVSSGEFGYQIIDKELWGQVRQLAYAFNDMSRRLKVYEDQNIESLRFERNKLEAVLLSMADGVLVCDDENRVVILNDTAAQLLSIEYPETFLGSLLSEYTAPDSETYSFISVLEAFSSFQAQPHLPAEGQEPYSTLLDVFGRTLKLLLSPIRDSAYNHLGFVMILHDVTKELEVDKLKTSFISNVSHELRTPVTTIKSYIDTLYLHQSELDEATYAEFMETVYHETDRLKKLVNDILDFSRLDEGTLPLEKELVALPPVVNLTIQSIKVLADQKSLQLTTAIESNLPLVLINADAIERVMRNLLSNAIKYTPEDGKVKVRLEQVMHNGLPWLEVSVEDNGLGIPAEHLPRLFDRFYRVENRVHTVKGTGLGLHLVKVAIESHHQGEVFVRSSEGLGSVFGFRLPLPA
jgi:two-component system, OmpR family, sensor histidine kinase NblS